MEVETQSVAYEEGCMSSNIEESSLHKLWTHWATIQMAVIKRFFDGHDVSCIKSQYEVSLT